MTQYTQIGSVTVDAFQWTGQAMSGFPTWAKALFIHPTANILCVPTRQGTLSAKLTDWVVQDADGTVTVMPNTAFIKLYH